MGVSSEAVEGLGAARGRSCHLCHPPSSRNATMGSIATRHTGWALHHSGKGRGRTGLRTASGALEPAHHPRRRRHLRQWRAPAPRGAVAAADLAAPVQRPSPRRPPPCGPPARRPGRPPRAACAPAPRPVRCWPLVGPAMRRKKQFQTQVNQEGTSSSRRPVIQAGELQKIEIRQICCIRRMFRGRSTP